MLHLKQKLHRPLNFKWILPTIPAGHATGFSLLYRCLHFLSLFLVSVESRNWSPSVQLRVLLLRVVAHLSLGWEFRSVILEQRWARYKKESSQSVSSSTPLHTFKNLALYWSHTAPKCGGVVSGRAPPTDITTAHQLYQFGFGYRRATVLRESRRPSFTPHQQTLRLLERQLSRLSRRGSQVKPKNTSLVDDDANPHFCSVRSRASARAAVGIFPMDYPKV